jgi:phage protein D
MADEKIIVQRIIFPCGTRSRVFENKTPSQAVKDIISRYGLQADCDTDNSLPDKELQKREPVQ